MRFNISQLRDHLRCPQLAYNRYVLRRAPADARVSTALAIGTMFHAYMAARSAGRVLDFAEQALLAPNSAVWDEWMKHRLWIAADAWSPPPEWTIEMIERPLSAPLGVHTLEGTLDALIRIDDWWWSLQWKTYTDDLDTLLQKVEIGWHESVAYPMLVEEWLQNNMQLFAPGHYAGTILGAVQKMPGYKMVADSETGKRTKREITDADRRDALTFHWISVKPELFKQRKTDLLGIANDMARQTTATNLWQGIAIRNPDACFGAFGNSRCPYWGACYDGADVMGEGFVEIEDRYARI